MNAILLKPKSILSDSSGFTLLETMIALAIMVLAFASILSLQSGAIEASSRTKEVNTVAMLAKGKMVEIEYEIEGKTFEEVPKENTGVFEAPFSEYRWAWTVKELTFPTISASGKGGDDGGGGAGGNEMIEMLTKLISKFLSKALREVTLTVTWKRGTGFQEFNLSTYWVDLNHEFELTE